MAGTCDSINEPWGSIKCEEFLEYLRTGQLLKDCAAWSKLISIWQLSDGSLRLLF